MDLSPSNEAVKTENSESMGMATLLSKRTVTSAFESKVPIHNTVPISFPSLSYILDLSVKP